GGVFCFYCNAVDDEQARIVRQVARLVFRYAEVFGDGYMIIASESPIQFNEAIVLKKLANDPLLRTECERFGISELCAYKDSVMWSWDSTYFVSDDLPTVEYPEWIRVLTRFGIIERARPRASNHRE